MFAIDKFKFKVVKEKDNYGSFKIEPLPTGYGVTIGNAIRRILLSSIKGAAITSVTISGVKHEYSTIPGVRDDVLNIILKLKQLSIRSHTDKPQEIELKVKGEKVVKAKDIKFTSEIEVANPDLEITELTNGKAKLDMKMQVEKGTGYVPGDEEKRRQVGVIPIDANFSPVKRVIINITKTRVGQQTDLDQLNLKIFTNDVISPKEALERAVEIYKSVISRFLEVIRGEEEKEEVVVKRKKKSEKSASSDLDIDKLNLSARLTNSLIKAGFKNLTELEGRSLEEIMEIRGLGQRSAEELFEIMKSYKLKVVGS